MAGRIICFHVPIPEAGSQRSLTAKTRMSISAHQKVGMLWPSRDTVEIRLSKEEPAFRAAAMPQGMAMMSATQSASSTSLSVMIKGPLITCIAGRP